MMNPVTYTIVDTFDIDEWFQAQVRYGEEVVSGEGVAEAINKHLGHKRAIVGVEIGVCLGTTTKHFLQNIPNINYLWAIDPYPTFTDWNGFEMTREIQNKFKHYSYGQLGLWIENGKLCFIDEKSEDFAEVIQDSELDFIFIDGDHSYEGVSKDIKLWWPKVKSGGIFAGHDIQLPTVQQAIRENLPFNISIQGLMNQAWMVIKP